jgi:hypothetical protein
MLFPWDGYGAVFCFEASGAQSRSKPRVSRPATNQKHRDIPASDPAAGGRASAAWSRNSIGSTCPCKRWTPRLNASRSAAATYDSTTNEQVGSSRSPANGSARSSTSCVRKPTSMTASGTNASTCASGSTSPRSNIRLSRRCLGAWVSNTQSHFRASVSPSPALRGPTETFWYPRKRRISLRLRLVTHAPRVVLDLRHESPPA